MALDIEIEVLKSVVNKLDTSLQKISEVSNSIGRLLAVHDERLNNLEKVVDKRSSDIDNLHARITTTTKEVVDKIEQMAQKIDAKMQAAESLSTIQHADIKKEIQEDVKGIEKRLSVLEQWRWYVLGVAAAAAYAAHIIFPNYF